MSLLRCRLIALTLEMEEEFHAYYAEWLESGEDFVPSSVSLKGESYPALLARIKSTEREETCPPNIVPDRTYVLVNETDRILGALNLRLSLNEHLFNYGGHIGYGIRPSERKKGYGKLQLQLALPLAKSFGLERVLLTCDDDNSASAGTITACGGILEDKRMKDDLLVRRYWIDIQ